MSRRERTEKLTQMMTARPSDPVIFLPWLGEFGLMLLFWIRFVHFFQTSHKIVCCRAADKVFFPSATQWITAWGDRVGTCDDGLRRTDINRIWRECCRNFDGPADRVVRPFRIPRFAPFASMVYPLTPERRGLTVDVVLGPRNRPYRPDRNWPHWQDLCNNLRVAGFTVGLIGHPSTSLNLKGAEVASWTSGNDGDACVELLQTARLYIGSDSGTSHLAAFCSTPSIIFRFEDGMSCIGRMQATTKGFFKFLPEGWDNPNLVTEAALRYLNGTDV